MTSSDKHPAPTADEAAARQAARAAAFARKQRWKERPGNRYTPEELRRMAGSFGPFTIHQRRTKVMVID